MYAVALRPAFKKIRENCVYTILSDSPFARIFYRNAINIGLPIIECPEASREIEEGDEVEIDFDSGKIYDRTKGTEYQGQAFPPSLDKKTFGEDRILKVYREHPEYFKDALPISSSPSSISRDASGHSMIGSTILMALR